jgi:hypothetical protein
MIMDLRNLINFNDNLSYSPQYKEIYIFFLAINNTVNGCTSGMNLPSAPVRNLVTKKWLVPPSKVPEVVPPYLQKLFIFHLSSGSVAILDWLYH